MSFFIHSSAIIEESAIIGKDSQVWCFSHVAAYARIGDNCILGQNVFIGEHVEIGNRVKIQNNVSVYTGVTIEDEVFLGPSVVFTNVINPRSFVSRKNAFKSTRVKKGASIGANATLICGIEIGSFAMIGAGSVVTKSVSSYALVTGNPAVQTGWMSQQGWNLAFDNDGFAFCQESGEKYELAHNKVERIK